MPSVSAVCRVPVVAWAALVVPDGVALVALAAASEVPAEALEETSIKRKSLCYS